VFRKEEVLQKLPAKVAHFSALLDPLRALPHVIEVRQCGLIAGIEITSGDKPDHSHPNRNTLGAEVCFAARKHGLLTRPILNTIVLMPPLCMTEAEMTQMVDAVRLSIEEVCGS
jgi:adenosylmethionine-8-amino-7-oxononanoate aminotransferase